jgi:hypothetical protein
MIALLVIGLILVGMVIGGAGMRRVGALTRRVTGPWRPGIGFGALICLFGGAALVVRGAPVEGAALVALGLALAIGARLRPFRRGSTSNGGMAADEARRILGVGADADVAAIEAAYRRLMQRAHPDLGGTSGLAAQLNAARDALTKG